MPFVFAIIGITMIIAGVRGTAGDLLTLLQKDLTGPNNFIYWILSILIIGSIGYVQDLRALSRAFLVLVIIVLVLAEDKNVTATGSGSGFFNNFTQAISSITQSNTTS